MVSIIAFSFVYNDVIHNWQLHQLEKVTIFNSADDTLYADDRASLLLTSECDLQIVVHSLSRICKSLGLQISVLKPKVIDFHGADSERAKIVVDSTVREQVSI